MQNFFYRDSLEDVLRCSGKEGEGSIRAVLLVLREASTKASLMSVRKFTESRRIITVLVSCYSVFAHALPCLIDFVQRILCGKVACCYDSSTNSERRTITPQPASCRLEHTRQFQLSMLGLTYCPR